MATCPTWSEQALCGRRTRYLPWSEIHRLYRPTAPAECRPNDAPRYNIAPTDAVPFVTAAGDGNHKIRSGHWWLVPFWAKEMPKGAMFNARIESVDTTPAFRDAFKSKRCLVPADGYYEWTESPAMVARMLGTSSSQATSRSRSPACGPSTRRWTSRAARPSPSRLPPRLIRSTTGSRLSSIRAITMPG